MLTQLEASWVSRLELIKRMMITGIFLDTVKSSSFH